VVKIQKFYIISISIEIFLSMARYIEINIGCATEEMAEIITAYLADYPFESFDTSVTPAGVALKAYIQAPQWEACRDEALALIGEYGSLFSEKAIKDENWNERWEQESFQRVNIDDEILIRASYHDRHENPEVMDIIVAPRMAFGSGHHQTTRMMCRSIKAVGCTGRVLDVGCGTGVLSFVALKSGAMHADAVDIDPWSVESAIEAAELNGLSAKMEIMEGTVESIEGRTYDMVLANINRNIILQDIVRYVEALNMGGSLLLSGFLEADAPLIEARAEELGLRGTNHMCDEGWVCLTFRK
jgi:ribosomal protein L11 methyltransferase